MAKNYHYYYCTQEVLITRQTYKPVVTYYFMAKGTKKINKIRLWVYTTVRTVIP